MKKYRGDEPISVIIHIYMEISQGNALCSYLYFKQTKMSFFFSLQNRRTGGWNRSFPEMGAGTRGREEVARKGSRREDMVQILCTGM
jgi:hypothetical protein